MSEERSSRSERSDAANDGATVSEERSSRSERSDAANDGATVSDETAAATAEHEPVIQIVKGAPTDDELAAIVAVLAAGSGVPEEPREQEVNLWGHPVDRLRYSSFSWQRVTLVERTHMRRY